MSIYLEKIETLKEAAKHSLEFYTGYIGNRNSNNEYFIFINIFTSLFANPDNYSGYKYIPKIVEEVYKNSVKKFGIEKIRELLFSCLIFSILNTLNSERFNLLPIRVKNHQLNHYARIIRNAGGDFNYCELGNDIFQKEFALSTMRLYAAGSQLIDHHSGIPRSILVKNGFIDIPRRLSIFMKFGGFKPFFEIHTHTAYLDEFNADGWNECYRCCSELYKIHPEILGMFGGSWFYDPALSEHSPRLNYLRETPLEGGAFLMYSATNAQSTHDATSTSVTRKKLYAEGKYHPKIYTLLWKNKDQINWNEKNFSQ
jgi:hypothetical protein